MPAYILGILTFATALLCVRSWALWWKRTSLIPPFPPGPNGLPIVGNIFDMPSKNQWETACKWGEQYGDLVSLKIFGTRYLFVNSYEAAVDLLEKRGNNYSTRPRYAMVELEGWSDWFAAIMPYGDELRKIRQLLHKSLQQSVTKTYYGVHTRSTHNLLFKLMETPDLFRNHIKHSAAETIVMVAYGYEVVENDPYVELVDKGVEAFGEAIMSFLTNSLPAVRHLPMWILGADFQKRISEGYELSKAMYTEPFNKARRLIADGTAVSSITSRLIDATATSDGNASDDTIIAKAVGVTYAGGGDSTVSVLLTFFLAMILYPETMRKGQEELDRVVGKDSLPTFNDRSELPYINAICSECLRWQAVAPLGAPHGVEKDDIYNGYFIPAGTIVLANIWAMLRNPKEYPDSEKFIPERWLAREAPMQINKMAFGFGRRICPGRHFAENSVFIGVASILAVFNIEKAVDASGASITPAEDYISSAVRHPAPFKCKVTPRSDEATALIRAAFQAAKKSASSI